MSVRILETIILAGPLVYKCRNILMYGYSDTWTHYSVGYLLLCLVSLVILSVLSTVREMKHTRKGVGGALYSLLIPMINLELLSYTPAETPSYQELQVQVLIDQVQMAVVLALSISLHFSSLLPCLLCSLLPLGSVLLQSILDLSLLEWVPITVSSAQSLWMLSTMFDTFPQTFSFGEGAVITQSCSLASHYVVKSFIKSVSSYEPKQSSYDSIATISACCLLTPAVVYALLPTGYRRPRLYYVMSNAGLLVTLILSIYLGHLHSVAASIVTEHSKVLLILWWFIITVGAVSLVLLFNFKRWTVTTVDRKYFHVMAVMIFLPGISWSAQLTKLASIAAFVLFIILEFVRYVRLPYYSKMLNDGLTIFLDKRQDSGSLILTHIYLLSGCALPLWFSSTVQLDDHNLSLYAGIISLGVGDSCASVFGSRFGRLRYPGSTKTVEGTLAAWLSMVVFSVLMINSSVVDVGWLSVRLLLVAALESVTQQVDNLMLPLYTFVMLSYSGL